MQGDDKEFVLKVDRHSRLMTADEQAAHAEVLQVKDDLTVHLLGDFLLKN